MSFRNAILWLLVTLVVLLVLLAVSACYLLLASIVRDPLMVNVLRWAAGALAALGATTLTLLVMALATERVLLGSLADDEPPRGGGAD
ncbi:MAG: hypothetical protein KDB14_32310 [Planctomycetales bacterium]|nr:hypothetical protein [Planctomycetales bacterium]